MVKIETYFETLSDAIDACQLVLDDAQAVPVESGASCPAGDHWAEQLACNPVNYGQTLQKNFALLTVRGRSTRRAFHVNIYRMDSGRYELNAYVS